MPRAPYPQRKIKIDEEPEFFVVEMCIFLLNNFTLPPDKALVVYLQSPGSPFVFCGAITIAGPSAVLSLTWPQPGSGLLQITSSDSVPVSAKIGVSVVDLASLQSLDVSSQRKIEHLALKVGENLFNFMQSFCGVDGNRLVVPMDILDRWFKCVVFVVKWKIGSPISYEKLHLFFPIRICYQIYKHLSSFILNFSSNLS
ncbi:hypothetical protein ACHQM5_013123 [Ranunculus cassubicifolius]